MSALTKEVAEFESKKELLKQTICKGASDNEFELFAMICKRTGLDPFARQVFPVFRWDSKLGRNAMTVQTSIDGYRVIAERTGNYAPGKEASFLYSEKAELVAATAYIKKLTKDGTWHEISATAFWNEYCQKNKEGNPTKFWEQMPHLMLSKCAEALALRKAFPVEMSGIYTEEEMTNALNPVEIEKAAQVEVQYLNEAQIAEIESLIGEDIGLLNRMLKGYQVNCLQEIPENHYRAIINALTHRKGK